MILWNIILTGLYEVWSHKFRSLLTLIGIALGVSSLIAMSAMVKGMENGMREALVAFGGMERILVSSRSELPVYQRHRTDQMSGLTLKDVRALEEGAPLLESVTPRLSMWDKRGFDVRPIVTRKGSRAWPYGFLGTWPNGLDVAGLEIGEGRMFTNLEDELAYNVCVIGTGIRNSLFGSREKPGREINPVGENLMINGVPFRIVGMFRHYQSKTASDDIFRGKNNTVYMPLNTVLRKLKSGAGLDGVPETRLSTIDLEVKSVAQLETAMQQARNVLMRSHNGLEDFSFETKIERVDELERFVRAARISGGMIAAIALVVGGIGITNIMLASISERIREIGIRKAIGASAITIFMQILIESAGIALLGGLVGLGVSFGLIHAISTLTPSDNTPIVSVWAMLVSIGFGVCIGIIAGLYPAVKASRLNPIEALRYG
jgi:putative ABC transport system permease protein